MMTPHQLEVLRRIKASALPLAIKPPSEDLEAFLFLADALFIDATVRNRCDFIVHSITPQGHEALEPPAEPPPEKKTTNWAMISAVIALAVFAATVLGVLAGFAKP
jgi:hypothetical protein